MFNVFKKREVTLEEKTAIVLEALRDVEEAIRWNHYTDYNEYHSFNFDMGVTAAANEISGIIDNILLGEIVC